MYQISIELKMVSIGALMKWETMVLLSLKLVQERLVL